MSAAANRMAAKVAETATKAAGKASQSGSSSGGARKGKETVLQKGARRDPELYVWRFEVINYVYNLAYATTDPLDDHDRRFRTCGLSLW